MTTERTSRTRGFRLAATLAWVAVALNALVSLSVAQSPPPLPPSPRAPPGQSQPPAPIVEPAPPGVPTPSMLPGSRPGFIDAFGRWVQDSAAELSSGFSNPGNVSDAAANAAKGTADVARGAADVTRGAADVLTNAARDTAGALSRLPTSRTVTGRERCVVAPNGAPDCRAAAETMCRAGGFTTGNSTDFESAEVCPSAAALARWRGEPVKCTTENYVTRALCQ